jgi:hypothetical protein
MDREFDCTAAQLLSAFFMLDRKGPMAPTGSPAVVAELAGTNGDRTPAPKGLSLEAWPRPWQSA